MTPIYDAIIPKHWSHIRTKRDAKDEVHVWTVMDLIRADSSIISWIGKMWPSGGGVDGSRLLGGRDGGGGERGHRAETTSLVVALSRSS